MKPIIPYQFGITNLPLKLFDFKEQNARRLERLLKLKDADLIIRICQHYISSFIPTPVENEDEYWIISCFPSTDQCPVRISIWFPEVFNISDAENYGHFARGLQCMIFVHSDFLDTHVIKDAQKKIKGIKFLPGFRYRTGIDQQLAVFLPIKSYFKFVEDERIFEGIRTHNYELTLKGRSPFKKGHNYELVRYLLNHQKLN